MTEKKLKCPECECDLFHQRVTYCNVISEDMQPVDSWKVAIGEYVCSDCQAVALIVNADES